MSYNKKNSQNEDSFGTISDCYSIIWINPKRSLGYNSGEQPGSNEKLLIPTIDVTESQSHRQVFDIICTMFWFQKQQYLKIFTNRQTIIIWRPKKQKEALLDIKYGFVSRWWECISILVRLHKRTKEIKKSQKYPSLRTFLHIIDSNSIILFSI